MSSELKALPKDTVRLIGSSQVITSVYSVVKELLENSFDAEATTVDIKLENFGFDKIEVRDNGRGIEKSSIPLVALRYHTSKIASFTDLESLATFGFRGEALGSLCAVSSLSITSKSMSEDVSHTYSFDHHGNIIRDQPSHVGQGTTVLASNLFSNMPVRRQYYKTERKKKEELRRVEELCTVYGALQPATRLTLRHNKELVWQKIPAPDTGTALQAILGHSVFSQLQYKTATVDDIQMKLQGYLPKADSDVSVTSRSVNDRSFVAVNGRPVQLKELEKVIRQHYCACMKCDGRYPVYFLSLSLPISAVDVNLDPNKSRVMLQQQKRVVEAVADVCREMYGAIVKAADTKLTQHDTSDFFTDTVNTSDSADSSFTSLNDGKGNRNTMKKSSVDRVNDANTDDAKAAKLTNKFGYNLDNERNATEEAKQYNISFYKGQDSDISETNKASRLTDLSTEREDLDIDIFGDSVKRGTTNNVSDDNQINTYNEVESVDFDVLDPDLNDLLKTQIDKSSDVHARVNDTEDFTKIVTDLNENQENVETIALKTKSDKNDLDGVEINVDTEWRRGSLKNQNGVAVLPSVQLLVPGQQAVSNKRPPSPSHDLEMLAVTPPTKKRSPSVQEDQPRIYDMVSSSNGDKFTTGFVAFSKQMRPKVVEENPDAPFDKITALVRGKWEKLTDSDREEFQQAGAMQVQELRKTITSKRQLGHNLDRRIAPVKGLPSIKDQLLAGAPHRAGSKTLVPVKSVRVAFSLSQLKAVYKSGACQSQTQANPHLRLIGPLKYYNGWVCCHGNKVKVINPHRVEETLLYRELMEEHMISPSRLESPQPISESCVGVRLYQALLNMLPPDSHQTYTHIEDKRLTGNGFQVRSHQDQEGRSVLELVGLSSAMPLYGMKDLQETLDLIETTRATTLNKARPLKVVFHLQGEAVRMIRQRPVYRNREDMLDLIQQMKESLLPVDCVQCLHNKPFLHTVYDTDDIPLTQSGLAGLTIVNVRDVC